MQQEAILIDAEVSRVLKTMAGIAGITVNEVIRRLLGLGQSNSHFGGQPQQRTPSPRESSESAPLQRDAGTSSRSRFPWMNEISSYLPLRSLAERFNACLDKAVPDTTFGEKTVSGMYVADPNFVTVKPQPRAGTLRISVYGPIGQLPQTSIQLKSTRHPYCEFLFSSDTDLDNAVAVLERAYRNRAER